MKVRPPLEYVSAIILTYPKPVQKEILKLRNLIYQTAENSSGVGEVAESLKWNEPTYSTTGPKTGTPIRLAWHKKTPDQFGLYVSCQTSLIESFKKKYPNTYDYDGNRGIIFKIGDTVDKKEIHEFIDEALTCYL